MPSVSLAFPSAEHPTPNASVRNGGCVIAAYRTYKGKKLGPYYFRKWKVGRKVYKQYIKPADVEKVRAECQHTKQHRRQLNRFLDNMTWLRQMCERYDRGKEATPEQEAYIHRLHKEGHCIEGPRPSLRPRRLTLIQRLTNIYGIDAVAKWFLSDTAESSDLQSELENLESSGFGAPIFSKVFLDWFIKTRNMKLSRFMSSLRIRVKDVAVDMTPTSDPQIEELQSNAIDQAIWNRFAA